MFLFSEYVVFIVLHLFWLFANMNMSSMELLDLSLHFIGFGESFVND